MPMRLVITALAAGLAVCGAAAPATAATKKKPLPNCAAKKSKTIAQSAEGRVYRIGTTAYGCQLKANKRFVLGDTEECQNQTQAGDFRFGKGVVGYKTTSCGLVSGNNLVIVKNLRTGSVKLVGEPVDHTWEGGESSTSIDNWEMASDGSIVWVGRNSGFVTTPGSPPAPSDVLVQVWKNEQGTNTKLDEGSSIAPDSLALGTLLNQETGELPIYWRNGATTKSATLR
jgi:hypothetical protein